MSSADSSSTEIPLFSDKRFCPYCETLLGAHAKFCFKCGTKIEDIIPSSTGPLSIPPQPVKSLTSRAQPSPVAEILVRHPVPTQSLCNIYFDLGIALADRQDYVRATEALQQALSETSSQVETTDILFYLAYAYDLSGKGEQAARTYLEAILQAPAYTDTVLMYIHHLLTPDIALALSTWVADEWEISDLLLTPLNRAHKALLLGHIHLYLANYDQTLEFFQEAAQLAPDLVPTMVNVILAPDILPPALSASEIDGNTHYTLAQLLYALRCYQPALAEINQALDIGITGESEYPQTPALQLKAQILIAVEDKEAAAQCFFEAGKNFYWSNDFAAADEQFSHAAELRPDHAPTYWYWADSLLVYSYTPEPPDTMKTIIEKCLEIWHKGYNLGLPDSEYAWAYHTKALINGQRVNLPYAFTWDLSWEAIIYLERAMLLGRQNAEIWANLGRYYRSLDIISNSLNASERALENDAMNLNALAERAAILANVGKYDEAEEAIKKYKEQQPDDVWIDGVKSFVLFHKGEYLAALNLIGSVLEDDKGQEDVWSRSFRADCYRAKGDHLQAAEDYRVVLNRYARPDVGTSDIPNQGTYGYAAYCLGEISVAISILENMLKDPTKDPYFTLGLCYLVQGESKQTLSEKYMHEGIVRTHYMQELDFLKPNFEDIESLASNSPPAKQVQIRDMLTRLEQAVEDQRNKLFEERPSLEDELKEVLNKYPRDGKAGNWAWLGAYAGLARLYTEEKRWNEAVQVYQLLSKEDTIFPEARDGLERAVNGLVDEGDTFLNEGNAKQALERFSEAFSLIPISFSNNYLWQGDLHTRLGFTHFSLNDHTNTRIYFARALQHYREHGASDPGEALSKLCQLWLHNATSCWNLDAIWRAMQEDGETDEDVRSNLASARNSLVAYLEDLFKLSQQNVEGPKFVAFVRPTILEIGEGLIAADTSNEWSLFKTYIPEMKERLMEDLGIEVGGVRVRGGIRSVLAHNAYTIKLDENLIVSDGHVELGRRYCTASIETLEGIGIPPQSVLEAPHPLTGMPGCWVPPDFYERVSDHSLDLWPEELVYIIYHVEAVLRRNLENFMRMQDVERLLNEWKQSGKGASLIASVLTNVHTKFYLARILRALVQEQVPIKRWEDILEATQVTRLTSGDCADVIRSIRLRLKQWLPGNNSAAKRIELPADWEEMLATGVRRDDDRVYFVAPPAETAWFLEMIRDRALKPGWNYALVTRSPELRPFVRLLVAPEFPFLAVLSEEELLLPGESDEFQTSEAVIMDRTETQVQRGTADA
jgi:tetratricopeptide (TPR) repeat protein